MSKYEVMLIISPQLDEAAVKSCLDGVKEAIAAEEGRVLAEDLWGRRRLAYPLKGFQEGFMALLTFELGGQKTKSLSRKLNLEESVLRYLLSGV